MGVDKIKTQINSDFKALNINTWENKQKTSNSLNKVETPNTVEILDLDMGPMSNNRYNTLVDNLNLNSIDNVDKSLKKIIIQNPHLVYQGIERKKFGNEQGLYIEANAYKLYDSKNNITIYIQKYSDGVDVIDYLKSIAWTTTDIDNLIKSSGMNPYEISNEDMIKILKDNGYDYVNHDSFGIERVDELVETINKLGDMGLTENINTITISDFRNPDDSYWAEQMNTDEFWSAGTGGAGEINVWGVCDANYLNELMFHESGHCLDKDYKLSGSTEWANAVSKDWNWASEYAADSYYNRDEDKYCEDFADSIRNLEMMGVEEFTKQYPNRAEILKVHLPEYFN